MEDTIQVEEEPYFGYMRGALTCEELKEADAYAEIFGIELRPFIQTLAHLNQIVRYEEYQKIKIQMTFCLRKIQGKDIA